MKWITHFYRSAFGRLANSKRIANKESEMFGRRVIVLFDDRPIRRVKTHLKGVPGLLTLYWKIKRVL